VDQGDDIHKKTNDNLYNTDMEATELKQILDDHLKWLKDEGGKRAYLQEADLRGADLQRANLQRANLRGADLQRAYLQEAYLQGANLQGAYLQGADLQRANLQGAYLQGADLQRANLQGADLRRADLQRAYLQGADLQGANLQGADLPHFQIPDGDLIVWKKGRNGEIIKLLIPKEAKRTASLIGRKCRAEYADVLEINKNGKQVGGCQCWNKDYTLEYEVGKRVIPDFYDDDIRIECTHGIHFFQTRQEAEEFI
jgi:hypothetical protein